MTRPMLLMTGIVLVSLVAAPAARAGEPDTAPRTLAVSGTGEVRAQPDRATVALGVLSRDPSLEAAHAEANRTMTALLKVARDLKVPDAQLHSTRISVSPDYSWTGPKRERHLVGYLVQRQLVVELKDLDRLGELIEKGLATGANLAGDPLLESSMHADLERQALARAVADARANAAVLARALDASVGAARSVAAEGAQSRMPMPVARMAMAGASASEAPETYQSGELTFTARVSVVFDLVPGPAPR